MVGIWGSSLLSDLAKWKRSNEPSSDSIGGGKATKIFRIPPIKSKPKIGLDRRGGVAEMKILAGGDSWALLVVVVTEWPSGRDENAMFRHPRNAEEKGPRISFYPGGKRRRKDHYGGISQ